VSYRRRRRRREETNGRKRKIIERAEALYEDGTGIF
jgi:hypothetical protein